MQQSSSLSALGKKLPDKEDSGLDGDILGML